VSRPLLVIVLTILVNLVGFGIIIPLLPFYAESFGASPLAIGLLFAVFSLAQLVAAPVLGDLSDRYGRRPVLVASLAGTVVSFVMLALADSLAMLFVARIVDGLSGGNVATARAYVADITEPKDRARAYGYIGAAFGVGFILGPAMSAVLVQVSYTAPIWAAAGLTLIAMLMAWFWLPETLHKAQAGTGAPFRNVAILMRRPGLRRVLAMDFGYWAAFAVFQTTFALFAARRFGFNASDTGFFFAAFAVLGAIVQGIFIRPFVQRLGDKWTFILGLGCAAVGLAAATMTYSTVLFGVALVPLALGIGFGHPTLSSLISRAGSAQEQGRVQGAASVLESLGRASLQRFGDATPYVSAACVLILVLILSLGHTVTDADPA
jgi:DHA1 family tetracycline resistance protein-like MFS transporter